MANESSQLSPLKQAYLALEKMQAKLEAVEKAKHEPIAIVGMGCRFPGGADNPETFWQLLRDGVDTITEIPSDRWDVSAYYDPDPNTPGKTSAQHGAFIRQVDQFDPLFFGIAPREAGSMDPQQRLLLEVTWEALENAGLAPDQLSGSRTGVFVAMTSNDYAQTFMRANDLTLLDAYYASGIAHSVGSGRLSYVLGLQGPSITVDTACSSSLVTVHLGVQSLRGGECRMALAGGVNLILSPENYVALSKYGMLAADGRCKTFDASADGFVRGEGCGMIVMKRLSDALADGDTVLAVIRGSAVNQDGPSSGLTAPNGPSQEAVIADALASANLEPGLVSYIETHGTGTSLGDPIEVQALAKALRGGKLSDRQLAIGSVKTNIGHIEGAAGIAGLMKLVLMLQHREIPPHLHLNQPSPFISWNKFPFVIPTQRTIWEGIDGRLIGGVSSFGFSGTNAHVLIEAAPEVETRRADVERPLHILALSARDENALRELAGRYAEHLTTHLEQPPADVCYTGNSGRAQFDHRLAVFGVSAQEIHAKLSAFSDGQSAEVISGIVTRTDKPKIAFLFTGQGSQYAGMGKQLYETQPTFRAALDQCAMVLDQCLEKPLFSVLFPVADAPNLLNETTYTQPALFALEYALAQLWRSWGVEPGIVMGHSVGEYVAAVLAGVFSLEDGLKLIAARGRLMGALPSGGTMAAVFADEARVRAMIAAYPDEVSLAAINGPENIVISGVETRVQAIIEQFKAMGVKSRRLTVSHAFHSPLMNPILDEFERVAGTIKFSPPRMRLLSNRTGKIAGAEISTPAYWREHLREAVQFSASVEAIQKQGYEVFLEIGPGATLLGMGQRIVEGTENPGVWLPSLRSGKDDWSQVLDTLGKLYIAGVNINWKGFDHDYPRRKVTLPTYPFQRARYWMPTPKRARSQTSENIIHPLLGYRLRSALKTVQFENQFTPETFSFLNDHRIYGAALLPATGYIELATAAGKVLLGEGMHSLEDFVIHDALVVSDGETRTAQLIVTSDDMGRYNFEYFTQGENESDWKLHASGALVANAGGAAEIPSLRDVQGRAEETITSETHYQRLADSGMVFGDSLHGVVGIWRRDGEALGEIRLLEPVANEAINYHIHPALLDACLQTLAWAVPASDDVYLPLSVDRFTLYRRPEKSVWSYAQLRSGDDGRREVLRGDIRVVDADGQVVAELMGIALKRAGADLLRQFAGAKYEDWLYEVVWKPTLRVGEGLLPAPNVLAAQVEPQFMPLAEHYNLGVFFNGLLPELEQLSTDYILQAFEQLGWKPRMGEQFTTDGLAAKLKIIKAQRLLFKRLLDILVEDNLLQKTDAGWQVAAVRKITDPRLLCDALLEEYPAYHAELTITGWCGDGLARALKGDVDPVQLLFPDGGAMAEKMYRDSPAAHVYSGMVGEAVKAAVAQLPAGRMLRILEIGGGTGGTTSHVLPHLPADQVTYTYTDIGALFVAKAQEKFAVYPFMRFQTLNIEEDPAAQGLAGQQFDLILAANVIHATANLHQTLAYVQQVLAPGGTFMMLEVIQRRRWVDITFGLTDGWWRFVDSDIRPDYALLNRSEWLNLLANSGFAEVAAVPDGDSPFDEEAVLISRKAAGEVVQPQGGWLIFADNAGVGGQLAEQLWAAGESVAMVVPGEDYGFSANGIWEIDPSRPEHFQRLLNEAGGGDWSLRGVVYLWALDVALPDDLLIEHLDDAQHLGLGSALNLVKALAQTHSDAAPRLWLVTRGAQAIGQELLMVAQSPLWGFGKTVALEHPELRPTRLDLDPASHDDAHLLFDEIHLADSEDQIAFRTGIRYAARLAHSGLGNIPVSVLPSEPWRVEIGQKGTLDSLRFATMGRRQPGAGEVEIRVYATGLNFKDVLNTLGMYPGDAGPLGGECAGEITAVGEGVTDLQVGDLVMTLAGGAFASHVVAPAILTVPLPINFNFHSGAGFLIPFITAYYTLDYLGKMQAGERVLIHAAAGGVGQAAVQLAQRAGAEIFATAGSEEKREYLRSLGVQHVMDSRSLDFADQIMQITNGKGVDLVLNSLAGEFIPKSLSLLADNGRFLEIGKSGLLMPEQAAALGRGIQYHIIDWTPDARDNPQLIRTMMMDLVQAVQSGLIHPLPYQTFAIENVVSAFRYMSQAKHVGKVIVTQNRENGWDGEIDENATYLVIGGLRGLGLLVAQWLAERGAKHLALMGRSSPDEMAQAALQALEASGVNLQIIQGDVSQLEDVNRALHEIEASRYPLRGIIHSAGVLDDGVLLHQEWPRFQYVMGPKVNGAWYLHNRTQHMGLSFFVMFSSVASLLGSSGQSNHAAANAFEDALAYHRRSLGLPGLSINWGAWSEIGAAVDRNVTARAGEQGIGTISPTDGIYLLEQLMRGNSAQVGVSPINWGKFLSPFGEQIPPFLSEMVVKSETAVQTAAQETQQQQPQILSQLAEAKPAKQRTLLMGYVQSHAAKVMGLNAAKIGERVPLNEMGLDSLMAVELRNLVGNGLGLKRSLPATLVFDYPTVEAIADYLARDVLSLQTAEAEAAPANVPDVIESIEDLSDDEVDRLLQERMKNKK
ncbi:MAG: SDR family NAD(P)-dependent oxidoreductase [Anaerolineae bacterium]|nr:SDR family NAD(P)-dependent oxidoreductase [Anaerolineae bacterium]